MVVEEEPAGDDGEPPDERGVGERVNDLLDRAFFDPSADAARDDDPSFVSGFRRLFNDDPEYATALYAGGVFAVLLFLTQQLVRIYKHCYFMPDRMCPWDVAPSADDLLNF